MAKTGPPNASKPTSVGKPKFKVLRPLPPDDPIFKRGYTIVGDAHGRPRKPSSEASEPRPDCSKH